MLNSLIVFMNFFLLVLVIFLCSCCKIKHTHMIFFNMLLVSFSSLISFVIHSSLSPKRIFLSVHWLLVLILMNCSPGMLYNYHHLMTFFFGFLYFFFILDKFFNYVHLFIFLLLLWTSAFVLSLLDSHTFLSFLICWRIVTNCWLKLSTWEKIFWVLACLKMSILSFI